MDQQDRDFNTEGSSPVDLSVLEQYRELQDEGDPDIVAELIDTFLSDIPNRVSGIREALDSANPTQLEHEAHNLKGSSANLGAHTLASISLGGAGPMALRRTSAQQLLVTDIRFDPGPGPTDGGRLLVLDATNGFAVTSAIELPHASQ